MNKKGYTLQELAPIAISFVVIAVVLGIGATVLSDVQESQCDNFWNTSDAQAPFCSTAANNSADLGGTFAENASLSGMEAIGTLADWLPTIGVIVAAAVVIGIIVAYFKF